MPGVAFDPIEMDFMAPIHQKELLPQVRILYLLPTFLLPVHKPALVNRVRNIFRVGIDLNNSVFPLDGLKSHYHGQKLHTVVCGTGEPGAHLLLMLPTTKDHSVTARPGIAARSAIGEKVNSWFYYTHNYKYTLKILRDFIFVTIFGNMNVLVTGANGQLGNELRAAAAGSRDRFIFTDVTSVPGVETVYLDITNADAVKIICDSEDVDVIVNCAAYTNVDKAEDDSATALLLNSTAAGILAQVAASRNATLIHISTDYVFHGDRTIPYKEDWPTHPLGVYGSTKLLGEKKIEESGCKSIIFRTAWLYSPYGNNFVKTMLRLTSERDSLKVVFDQVGTPTYAKDLAMLILKVIGERMLDKTGIYHFSDEGAISWYDFSKAICQIGGNTCDISPCHTEDYPSKAERPHFSVLDKTKVKATFGIRIPYWRDSLEDCVKRIKGR